jgi:hypothetical protein
MWPEIQKKRPIPQLWATASKGRSTGDAVAGKQEEWKGQRPWPP